MIVLDGSWGTGKSTFVKQWAGHMRNRGHPVVYFDAFRCDHHTDPLFAMLAALTDLIAPRDRPHPVPNRLREQLTASARGIARVASGIVLDTGARALTGGLITGDHLDDAFRRASAADGPAADDHPTLFDTKLAQARDEVAATRDFRDTLANVVTELTHPHSASPPLIFVVDELDRCKPSFALDVLERIKHVFSADNVCFVLVTHLTQLAEMAKRAYGLHDARLYLDKFFHLRIDINRMLASETEDVRTTYLEYLCREMGLDVPQRSYFWWLTIQNLARVYALSLRSMERVVLNLTLYAKTERLHRYEELMSLAAALCVMRVVKPAFYAEAAAGTLELPHALGFLNFDEWPGGRGQYERIEQLWTDVLTISTDDGPTTRMVQTSGGRVAAINFEGVLKNICADIDLFWDDQRG